MSTPTPRPLLRITVRKTVHLVTTLEVFADPTPAPPERPTFVTTGETVEELPPSQPSIRSTRPTNVVHVQFPVRRTGTRGMSTVRALILAAIVGAVGVGSAMYAASLGSEPSMGAP